jgi:hypothetical protein
VPRMEDERLALVRGPVAVLGKKGLALGRDAAQSYHCVTTAGVHEMHGVLLFGICQPLPAGKMT